MKMPRRNRRRKPTRFQAADMINGGGQEPTGAAAKVAGLLDRVRKERNKNQAPDAPQAEPKERGVSLFERVTGTGRARAEEAAPEAAEPAAQPEPAPQPEPQVSEGGTIDALIRSRAAAPEAVEPPPAATVEPLKPAAQPAPEPQNTAEKPALGGMDPADRPAPAESEDDLLDIPAFLRRQAN